MNIRVSPISLLFGLFLSGIAMLCLVGNPLKFSVEGVNTSVLEVLAAVVFLLVLFMREARRSPLWSFYMFLILTSIVPLVIGVAEEGLVHALRDFSQIIYVSFIFVGHLFYKRNYLHPQSLITILCWLSAFLALIYLLEHYFLESAYLVEYIYSWRVIFAFSFVCLFAQFISVERLRIKFPIVALMLLVIILFAVEIRTRAFLLMLAVAAVILCVGFFASRKTKGNFLRFSTSVFLIVLLGGISAAGWVSTDISTQSSLSRLLVIMDSATYDVTMEYRLDAWAMAANGIVENPVFGQGLGSYLYLDPWVNGEYQYYPSAMIHNTFLQILYVGGITHLVGYLLLLFGIFKYAGYSNERTTPRENSAIRLMLRSFLIGYLFYAAFGTTLFAVNEAAVFWFLVGYFCHYSIPGHGQSVRFGLFLGQNRKQHQFLKTNVSAF